jgi:hypothetical protein
MIFLKETNSNGFSRNDTVWLNIVRAREKVKMYDKLVLNLEVVNPVTI